MRTNRENFENSLKGLSLLAHDRETMAAFNEAYRAILKEVNEGPGGTERETRARQLTELATMQAQYVNEQVHDCERGSERENASH